MPATVQPVNESLRLRLGIPADAEKVLIFTESSHWDPNWLMTSDGYFDRFVRDNLDQAIEELQREPRRIYSIECMFFLRMYWERCPEKQEIVRALVNEGRFRLTSSGVTTADTLLPSTEAILRDFLVGQEWLRANEMTPEPTLAYFTDSFGCTPTLPSLLRAAGFDRTAMTRIDGMYFMGCDLESSKAFPRPGSSAERLLNQERTLDFVWRDRNDAQVLCHWNAFNYGQGDMLAYRGLSRVYLVPTAIPARSDRHVARRVKQYAAQLAPYSRTPYMLCPIGMDFVPPIPDLVALLDCYNRNHYPTTGIWAVNAGLDDYLALVEAHQDDLPIVELTPNPYWTGFYTARPNLKRRCRELVDDLLVAERLSLMPENVGTEMETSRELAPAWWNAVVSNHHDFITGTSPDEVVEGEQIPWLEQAADSVRAITDRLAGVVSVPASRDVQAVLPEWRQQDGRIRIETPFYVVELAEDAGGTIVSLQTPESRNQLLASPSNDLISYRDSGGLWRMGYEFRGGTWKEAARASQQSTQLEVREHDNGLEIVSATELNRETIRRRMWFRGDTPVIRCRVEGRAAEGHSVVVRFATGLSSSKLTMDTPGGVAIRPPMRFYDPTFWPLQRFVHLQDDRDGRGLALLQSMPGAVSYQPEGILELVALRNAPRETAFGVIKLPANPASGHETESTTFDYAFLFTSIGDWRDNGIPEIARSIVFGPWDEPARGALQTSAATDVTTDRSDVWVTAVKPASRGDGVIVRLTAPAVPETSVTVTALHLPVTGAFLCDARERDLAPLDVQAGTVQVVMTGTVATIRLLGG
jgi:alpha-mannosidase